MTAAGARRDAAPVKPEPQSADYADVTNSILDKVKALPNGNGKHKKKSE